MCVWGECGRRCGWRCGRRCGQRCGLTQASGRLQPRPTRDLPLPERREAAVAELPCDVEAEAVDRQHEDQHFNGMDGGHGVGAVATTMWPPSMLDGSRVRERGHAQREEDDHGGDRRGRDHVEVARPATLARLVAARAAARFIAGAGDGLDLGGAGGVGRGEGSQPRNTRKEIGTSRGLSVGWCCGPGAWCSMPAWPTSVAVTSCTLPGGTTATPGRAAAAVGGPVGGPVSPLWDVAWTTTTPSAPMLFMSSGRTRVVLLSYSTTQGRGASVKGAQGWAASAARGLQQSQRVSAARHPGSASTGARGTHCCSPPPGLAPGSSLVGGRADTRHRWWPRRGSC